MLKIKNLEFSTKNANANIMTHDIMHNFQNIMQKMQNKNPQKYAGQKACQFLNQALDPGGVCRKENKRFRSHMTYI